MSFCVLATTSAQTTVADSTKVVNTPATRIVADTTNVARASQKEEKDNAPTAVAEQTGQKAAPKRVELTPAERQRQLVQKQRSLEKERDSLQREIAKTRRLTDTVKAFIPRKLDLLISSLRQEELQNRDNIAAAQKLADSLSAQHKQAKSTLDSLKVYAEIRKEGVYNKKYLPMLAKKFSELSEKEMDDLRNSINEYKYKSDYQAKADTLLKNMEIYKEGCKLLELPLDTAAINKHRYKTYALVYYYNNKSPKNTLNAEQFKEMDDLDLSLARYANGVIKLDEIITSVNENAEVKKLREEKKASEECIKKIESIVSLNDSNKAIYERYFNRLPYLQKMINDYLEEIRKDPFTTTKTEEEIKKLCSTKQ